MEGARFTPLRPFKPLVERLDATAEAHPQRINLWLGLCTIVVMSIIYYCTNRLAMWHGMTWSIPIIDLIDGRFLWKWSIIPYAAFYPILIWSLIRPCRNAEISKDRLAVFEGVWTLVMWSNLIFLLAPNTVPIADLVDTTWKNEGGLTGWLWLALDQADEPSNGFPSLHVSIMIFLAIEMSTRFKPRSAPVILMWLTTTIIVLSTLTTGQHQVLDLAGGIALAMIAARSILTNEDTIESSGSIGGKRAVEAP